MTRIDRATQLAVIGAGPGGYAAAFMAADLGMQVALVDPAPHPGGVCLYRGCIPSKALLHVAKLIHEVGAAADFGLTYGQPELDPNRLRAWKDEVVAKLTGGLGQLCKQRKIDYVRGRARFEGPGSVWVEDESGEESNLMFENAILATGSLPTRIPGIPDSPGVLDSTSALEVHDVPGRLLVIGGGYIGLELGSVYAALGSQVTLVEMMPTLLPGADKDLVKPLAKRAENDFENVWLKTRVAEVEDQGGSFAVAFEGSGEAASGANFDQVLVAVGRRPNVEGLGLESTGLATNAAGFIEVDAQRQTQEPSLYAIGDVAGEPMLAHKASHEGRIAALAIAGHEAQYAPRAIPAVVFTDPELAWCGLTEAEAKEQGRDVEVARFAWGASGRAATLGRSDGLTKLVIDPKDERVLGMGIVGPGAGELIAEGVLAIELEAKASDVARSIHPHPTLSETVMEAAEVFFGHSTHVYRPKRAKK